MANLSREKLLKELRKKYPLQNFRTTEEFNGNKGGVWTSGESVEQLHGGLPLFDYYAEGNNYVFGVVAPLHDWLEEKGWYGEWYDAGTMMIWEI